MTMVSLLPLIIGAAVLPVWIVMTLLMLRGEGGVLKATAFATGAMTVRLVQGILFGAVFGASGNPVQEQFIVSTLSLVVGIVLLTGVARSWMREVDPDAPPPRWMTALGEMSPLTAFGIATLMLVIDVKQWIFTLSAIAVIDEAQVSRAVGVVAFLVFTVAAQGLVLAPVAACILMPARSARMLDAAQAWLERNSRAMTMTVSLVFGVWFSWKGISGLLAPEHPPLAPVAVAARLS
ncbi:MAG: GAP family protein [Tepidisphaeraceae bacterium]